MQKNWLMQNHEFVDESLKGIYLAHQRFYESANGDMRAFFHRRSTPRRVGIVTGGVFGYLPISLGYVGEGLCDGCAVGDMDASPSVCTITNVARAAAGDDGVLFLLAGDDESNANFSLAAEVLKNEGIASSKISILNKSADWGHHQQSGCLNMVGLALMYKIAGAYADLGAAKCDVMKLMAYAIKSLSTFGVIFSPFSLSHEQDSEMREHDRNPRLWIKTQNTLPWKNPVHLEELGHELTDRLIHAQKLTAGARIAVLLNGLGMYGKEELYALYPVVAGALKARGAKIAATYVGGYANAVDTASLSVSILKLDDQLEKLLNQPYYSPFVQY